MNEPTVSNHPQSKRYEAQLDGAVVGRADYELGDGVVTLTHTEVEPQFEGRGIASRLVRAALDDIRADGRKVVPQCAYVKGWLEKHPDYLDLVYGEATPVCD